MGLPRPSGPAPTYDGTSEPGPTTVGVVDPLVTALIYGVIPLGALALLALLTMARPGSRPARYRVGDPWDHEPVWWVGNPKGSGVDAPVVEAVPSGSAPLRSARGGARGTW